MRERRCSHESSALWHDVVVDGTLGGQLLVATPLLIDPNFWRSVVLILQHDDDGSLGLVLNRPTVERVETHIPVWGPVAAKPGTVHFGGPVEPRVAIGLATGQGGEPTGVPGLSIVDLEAEPGEGTSAVRIYSGYAGWGQGQLELEIAEGSWYVVPASPDDPFDRPEGQWSRILRRQNGHLALVSTFPDDVDLN
jgi:putative transcriptional regulator